MHTSGDREVTVMNSLKRGKGFPNDGGKMKPFYYVISKGMQQSIIISVGMIYYHLKTIRHMPSAMPSAR